MSQWIERMTLRGKLSLVGAVAAVMMAVPTAWMLGEAGGNLARLKHEEAGIEPAAQLLALARLTAQHRGLSGGALAADGDAASRRSAAWAQLQARAEPARQAIASLADASLSQALDRLLQEQHGLAGAVAGRSIAPAASFARHTQNIDAQLALVYQVASSSELVHHREPGGYFLQDAALNHLPWANELLGRLRGTGAAMLREGSLSATDRAQLATLLDRAEQLAAQGHRALTLAVDAEPSLKQPLAQDMAAAQRAVADFALQARQRLIESDGPELQPEQW